MIDKIGEALASRLAANIAKLEQMGNIDFTSVSPVVPVRDLDAALDRYRRLGFDVRAYSGPDRYGYVDRGAVQIHLSEWTDHDPHRSGAVVYLYVSDADALRGEWKASGVEGRLTKVRDTPYGLREFAFIDGDGTRHRVGSPLAQVLAKDAGACDE